MLGYGYFERYPMQGSYYCKMLSLVFLLAISLSVPAHAAGALFPPEGLSSSQPCPSGQVLGWTGNSVACTDPTPGVTVSCGAGQTLTGISNGAPICVVHPSWVAVPLTSTTPFNMDCEYRVWVSSPSQNVYYPFHDTTKGPAVGYPAGIGPHGDLILVAHSGVVSGILHTDKTQWVWTNGSGTTSLGSGSVTKIEARCPN